MFVELAVKSASNFRKLSAPQTLHGILPPDSFLWINSRASARTVVADVSHDVNTAPNALS
jgi:hypothetical protein